MATRVDAGRDSQHDACALAETLGDGGDTLRLARLVHDDLVEALFDGQLDFRIGLVVAVQHEAAAWDARGERDAHLTHGAGVDEHAGFGDDAADFLAQQRFAGEADVGDGVVERVGGRMHEFRGAGAHVIGVDDVERRTEFVEQACGGAAVEGDLAFVVHGRAGRPDWAYRHGLRISLFRGFASHLVRSGDAEQVEAFGDDRLDGVVELESRGGAGRFRSLGDADGVGLFPAGLRSR